MLFGPWPVLGTRHLMSTPGHIGHATDTYTPRRICVRLLRVHTLPTRMHADEKSRRARKAHR